MENDSKEKNNIVKKINDLVTGNVLNNLVYASMITIYFMFFNMYAVFTETEIFTKKIEEKETNAMKLMIASDIHGSAYYCLEMLDAMKKECPDRLLLLGDILYHGPRNDLPLEYEPKKVIKMLNEVKEKLFCVRGNCDTEVDQMVLDFPIMADYAVIP